MTNKVSSFKIDNYILDRIKKIRLKLQSDIFQKNITISETMEYLVQEYEKQ